MGMLAYRWFLLSVISVLPYGPQAADSTWIRSTLLSHFSRNRHHAVNAPNKEKAMNFIYSYMKDTLKLDAYLDEFTTENPDYNGTNVIGILRGKNYGTKDDVYYGIGAHYDTVRTSPGVDDNGSGVTIMLDAATSLVKNRNRKYTLIFISFDLEESDGDVGSACSGSHRPGGAQVSFLCGSYNVVYEWLPSFFNSLPARPSFGGIYIMDTMMGFNDTDNTQELPLGFDQLFPKEYGRIASDDFDGDFVAVIGRRDDEGLTKQFNTSWSTSLLTNAETESVILPIDGVPTSQETSAFDDFFRSDHSQFWSNNLTAVFLTDTANFRGYMRQCYHEECDNGNHVTNERVRFMATTSDALYKSLDTFTKDHSSSGSKRTEGSWACLTILGLMLTTMFPYFN